MRISDWISDVCSSDLLPAASFEQSNVALQPRARMCSPSAVSRDWVSWPMRWAMTAAMDGVAVPKLAFSQSRNPSFRVVLICRFAFLILGVVRKGSFLHLGQFERSEEMRVGKGCVG